MLKRMWAIVISVVMLVSLCPSVSVFAASKTDFLIEEGFEGASYDTSKITNIGRSTAETLSPTIVEGGKNGGNALLVTGIGPQEVLGINHTAQSGRAAYLSYDINIRKLPDNISGDAILLSGFAGCATDLSRQTFVLKQYEEEGNKRFVFFDNRSSSTYPGAQVDICEAKENTWYKMIWTLNGNSLYGVLLDEDGDVLFAGATNNYKLETVSIVGANATTDNFGNGEVLIDNVYFNCWNRTTYGATVVGSSIDDVINAVPQATKSVKVSFDTQIKTPSAKLKTASGAEVEACTMTATDSTNLTYNVSWTTDLSSETSYVLDLTATKNDNNKTITDSTGAISFTTETVAAPAITNSTIANGATNVLKNVGSVTVTFDSALATMGATLTPAGGSAVACDMTAGSAANTYVVTLPTLKGDTTYTLGFATSKNAAGVPVSDAISFTTEAASIEETVLTDDFEDTSLFTGNTGTITNGYYNKEGLSAPFKSGTYHGAFAVPGYPNNSGTAAEIRFSRDEDAGANAWFSSSSAYEITDGKAVVLNYKMKISNAKPIPKGDGTFIGGNRIIIGADNRANTQPASSATLAYIDLDAHTGEHYIGFRGNEYLEDSDKGKKGFYYKENQWYNVTFLIDGTKEYFALTDISTGELLWEQSVERSTSSYLRGSLYISPAFFDRRDRAESAYQENKKGAAVTIDDIALWQINTAKATHALVANTPSVNENAVTLSFNQPTMVDADMLAVSTDSEGNTPVEADIDVKYTDFDTNVVTISGLDYGKTYYLDYSAVTSAGGAAIASGEQATSLVAFTMPHPAASIMDKAAYASGSVTLDYWNMDGKANAAFIAAFYKGTTLVDVALLANQALSANKNEVSFAAADVPADADGMIVYALNSLGSLVPLCVPTAKVSIK